jgi:iron uptake system component EfeO
MTRLTKLGPVVLLFTACGSDDTPPPGPEQVAAAMQASIAADLTDLVAAAKDLQTAAPTPSGRGWNPTDDAAAVTAMKAAWRRTRIAYEHVEGALAPIFPDLDVSMDARYDDYLAILGAAGDPDAFDDQGATGMHSIERILYSDQIRPEVVAFESNLPGYGPAAFPATAADAVEFKTKLVQRLIDDATSLKAQWTPANVDIDAAFQGLIDLMNEQHEKVTKAATGEEESRYSQMTLFDLRNNLDGTQAIYDLFQPWLRTKANGPAVDAKITDDMNALGTLYDSFAGDEIPSPPTTWSSDDPSQADLQTPFGMLFTRVNAAVDADSSTSIVGQMTQAATILGLTLQ